jgi:hypothetical protein
MSSLLETLMGGLSGGATREISRKVGADEGATSKLISGALPVLIGALTRNTRDSGGAESLASALDRDHDGSLMDDLAGFLGKGPTEDGNAILGHVLGGRRSQVEAGLGRASGVDAGSVAKILAMLAPVVLGALGREKRRNHLDAGGLAGLLGQETDEVERKAPGAMGVVGNLLDTDGDGQVVDDIFKIGGDLLGGFLGGKR